MKREDNMKYLIMLLALLLAGCNDEPPAPVTLPSAPKAKAADFTGALQLRENIADLLKEAGPDASAWTEEQGKAINEKLAEHVGKSIGFNGFLNELTREDTGERAALVFVPKGITAEELKENIALGEAGKTIRSLATFVLMAFPKELAKEIENAGPDSKVHVWGIIDSIGMETHPATPGWRLNVESKEGTIGLRWAK